MSIQNMEETGLEAQIQQDPLAVLATTKLGKSLSKTVAKSSNEMLPAESAELIVEDVRDKVAQLVLLEKMIKNLADGSIDAPHENVGADFETYREIVRALLAEYIQKYGSNISLESERIRVFYDEPNYRLDAPFSIPTYANFEAARSLLQQLTKEKTNLSVFFAQYKRAATGDLPGFESVVAHMSNGSTALADRITKVEADTTDIWRSEEVRMAWLKRMHLEYIKQMDEGRAVLETPTVIRLLNRIHEALFGSKAYKVSGPALVGPPGWGKTSMLQDYFRSFGLEPLSADIDPGQSAFSLMARPTLGLEKGLEEIKALVALVDDMEPSQIKRICELDPEKFNAVFDIAPSEICVLGEEVSANEDDESPEAYDKWERIRQKIKAQLEAKLMTDFVSTVENLFLNKGYSYNLILKGLQQNKPVILNEFPELQEWTFLHGLLTAVPSTDEDAAPRPTLKPKEGEQIKSPNGWFFNTITGDWMRVPKHFRICFTGNIGVEYGNTGLPPALMSRIGGGLIQIDGLPPEELARCIVWPLLSSKDTGKFLLKDDVAYKLHFLITDFFPKLQTKLNDIADESFTIATREIIDLCRCLHPYHNQNPCSLDEALMRTLVRPAHARRFLESLKFIVAMLKGTGFLSDYSDELEQMDKSLASDRTEKMIAELKNPFRASTYVTDKKKFEGKCMVCGVLHCPIHGSEAKDFAEFAGKASDLAKVGLDMRLINMIGDFLKKVFDKEQYAMFMELHVGNLDQRDTVGSITSIERKKISEYLDKLQQKFPKNPEKPGANLTEASEIIKILAIAVKKLFISKAGTDRAQVYKIADAIMKQTMGFLHDVGQEQPDFKTAILKIRNYIEVKHAILSLKLDFDDSALVELLRTWIPRLDPKLISSIAEAYPDQKELQADIKSHVKTNAGEIVAKFNEEKGSLFTDKMQAKLKKSHNKDDRSLLSVPEFEMLYPKFIKLLDDAKAMLELGIITTTELQEITRYAEYKMNQAVRSGFTPKSFTTYIRVIRKLADIKQLKLDEIVSDICKPTEVSLPPMKSY